jgi:urea ABC transporter ATP-binding protein UrtE
MTGKLPLLIVCELSASYGTAPVVRRVSLTLEQGQIVGVIGRNGVGKTTFLKSLMGLVHVTGGEILLDGKNVTAQRPDQRARMGIGYVPQGRHVFPMLTVSENLQMGRLINWSGAKDLSKKLELYFPILRERADTPAGLLSGGQQQQLVIARALIACPRLLILDEPSEGIQPSINIEIAERLKQLNTEEGITILFVEQNLDMIVRLAKRCYVMDKGELVEEIVGKDVKDEDFLQKHLSI